MVDSDPYLFKFSLYSHSPALLIVLEVRGAKPDDGQYWAMIGNH